jgi:amidase
MPDLARTTRTYSELLLALLSADLPPDDRARFEAAVSALPPDDQSLAAARLRGATMSHAAWARTSRIGTFLRTRWQAVFQDVDVILCPAMPTTAFRHDHSPLRTRQLDVDGKKIPYSDQLAWAAIATLTGLPATVAPIGRDASGLPIGGQIIGGYLNDRTTIAFAGLIEREFGGFVPPPNF